MQRGRTSQRAMPGTMLGPITAAMTGRLPARRGAAGAPVATEWQLQGAGRGGVEDVRLVAMPRSQSPPGSACEQRKRSSRRQHAPASHLLVVFQRPPQHEAINDDHRQVGRKRDGCRAGRDVGLALTASGSIPGCLLCVSSLDCKTQAGLLSCLPDLFFMRKYATTALPRGTHRCQWLGEPRHRIASGTGSCCTLRCPAGLGASAAAAARR